MTPHICIIENSELDSGKPLSVYLTALLRNLGRRPEFEIDAIVARSQSIPEAVKENCHKIIEIPTTLYSPTGNLRFTLAAFSHLRRINQEAAIQRVHCLYPNSSLMAAVLFKRLVNRQTCILYDVRSPWIDMIFARGHLPGFLKPILRPLLYLLERWLSRHVDEFIFISQGLKSYYLRQVTPNAGKALVLSTPVDTDLHPVSRKAARAEFGYAQTDLLLGYIGTIDASRRLEQLLDFFHEAAKSMPHLRLVFAGEGNALAALEQRATDLGLNSRVHFLGVVPHAQVATLISGLDYGISHLPAGPLYDFSAPLKVTEYLACEVPVLASDMPAHRELAAEFDGIYLYKDAKEFLQHLNRPKPRPDARQLEKHSWSRAADLYATLYTAS